MGNGCLAGRLAQPAQDIDQASRQTGLFSQHRQCNRGDRCELAGLYHHAVACRDRGRNLPSGGEGRRIPRRHLKHHAERLAPGIVQMA